MTRYARTYQILLHFEKPLKPYTSKEIVELVTKRFQKMDIALGDILEPIASLCSPKDSRPWNGMVKVHLKDPSKDAEALLTDKRVFAMEFDNYLRVPKISKSFDNITPKELLAVQVQRDNFKMIASGLHKLPLRSRIQNQISQQKQGGQLCIPHNGFSKAKQEGYHTPGTI